MLNVMLNVSKRSVMLNVVLFPVDCCVVVVVVVIIMLLTVVVDCC